MIFIARVHPGLTAFHSPSPTLMASAVRTVSPVDPEASRHSRNQDRLAHPCSGFEASLAWPAQSSSSGWRGKRQILLNRLHDFTHPGYYVVKATRHLSYFGNFGELIEPSGQASATFTFTIVAPQTPEDIKDSFAPYLADPLPLALIQAGRKRHRSSQPCRAISGAISLADAFDAGLKAQASKDSTPQHGKRPQGNFRLAQKDDFCADQQLALQASRIWVTPAMGRSS